MNCKKKLLEIYEPIAVFVKCSKHMVTELFGISGEEAVPVDVHERVRGELSVGTVLLEPLVPLYDGVLAVVSVRSQVLQILLGQFLVFF